MANPGPNLEKRHRCAGGWVAYYRHHSQTCKAEMGFSVFTPPRAEDESVPVLYWLSGLTCTEENFMVKAGAQRFAAEAGMMLVAPDTSPRGLGIPGEDERYDLGSGAGFYVDATRAPWAKHYRMFSYVTEELPSLIEAHFPVLADKRGIFGHSMGGHGALVCALRHPERYRSVSAFAPICAPSRCPWGHHAFTNYLGEDRAAWENYDACALLAEADRVPRLLVDQGDADEFLTEQLKPQLLRRVCQARNHPLDLRMRAGYDHSYYFIQSYMEDHIRHHAHALCG